VRPSRPPPPIRRAGSAAPHNAARRSRATGVTRLRGSCSDGAFGFAFQLKPRVLMSLAAGNRGDALHESKMLSGLRFSSPKTASMTFDVSDLENPLLRRRLSRSSSVWATMRCRAALMPATNGAGEELAKLFSAGAASWAKRCAGEFRMPDRDLLEILDAPEIAVHTDRAEIEARNPKRLAADFAIKPPEICPASEEAGRVSISSDHSAVRRDQIRVKLSSPSPFTSEA
jgi:hypothetical protein